MHNRPIEQGFTLIEVLLAMTLVGIMMALLFAGLKISAESWEKSESKVSELSEMAAAVNFFQRHLVDARPLWNDFNTEERLFSFQGSKDAVQFVSAFPASAGRSGLQLFSVALADGEESRVVKVTLSPFYPPAEGDEPVTDDDILVGGVKSMELAYFGKGNGDSESRWYDQWLEEDNLPSLVKINIALEKEIFWPEMVFELKMSAQTDNGGQPGTGQTDAAQDDRDNDQ